MRVLAIEYFKKEIKKFIFVQGIYIIEEKGGKNRIEKPNRPSMGRVRVKPNYEELRKAQIMENQVSLLSPFCLNVKLHIVADFSWGYCTG